MRFFQSIWFPLFLGVIIILVILSNLLKRNPSIVQASFRSYEEGKEWTAPSPDDIPTDNNGDLVRYGKELIVNTALYLGPRGIVGAMSNGMNCQNCHLDGGTRNYANPFSAVASTYPKYRDRSGRLESIEFRVNECMQRSLNGQALDSLSYEMKAMKAYLQWIGQGVPKDIKPKGAGTTTLTFLDRAADPAKGQAVFEAKCQRCHGSNGEGTLVPGGKSYQYPPLWGQHSFNVTAGMYRLSTIAGFIKANMPFDKPKDSAVLSDGEAWDVAAFITSQQHPVKHFAYDWPNIAKKPVDFPFGPYTDSFPEIQHKYGPFGPIADRRKKQSAASAAH